MHATVHMRHGLLGHLSVAQFIGVTLGLLNLYVSLVVLFYSICMLREGSLNVDW